MSLEGYCAIRGPGDKIVDTECLPAQHGEKRANEFVVTEHKTLAGMCCWIVAWRKGATDSFTVVCVPAPGFGIRCEQPCVCVCYLIAHEFRFHLISIPKNSIYTNQLRKHVPRGNT